MTRARVAVARSIKNVVCDERVERTFEAAVISSQSVGCKINPALSEAS